MIDRDALDRAGIDPAALQRLADACGPLVVVTVAPVYGETVAELEPKGDHDAD